MAPRSRTGWYVHKQDSTVYLFYESTARPSFMACEFVILEDSLTCRGRKLKCSEERPVCAQCAKANRECIPSSGITFRHQQNPSMNGGVDGDESLKSFYGYKETFGKATVWVDVPRELTFVHTNNPYEDAEDGPGGSGGYVEGDTTFTADASGRLDGHRDDGDFARELAQAVYPTYATHGLEALSAVASQDQYTYAPPPAHMDHHGSISSHPSTTTPQQTQATVSHNLDYILNPSSLSPTAVSNIDPQLHAHTPASHSVISNADTHHANFDNVRTQSYSPSQHRPSLHTQGSHTRNNRRAAIEDPEIAFLLRDFSEREGLWMDLFDLNLFFSTVVPVLAVNCPLLLYSCIALSAKGLGRVAGRKPIMGGYIVPARQCKMEKWPGPHMNAEDWVHKARQYYDLAVSLLRQALEGASRPPTSALPEEATPGTISAAQNHPLPTTDSDELVAATSILCVYEFFDVSGAEWSRHLDGAKSLFDIANDRMMDLTRPPSPVSVAQQVTQRLAGIDAPRPGLSKGRRAVFWCFARQDMLSAFINHTSTRLDTSDLTLWRSAGLKITPDGFVCPSTPRNPDYVPENAMTVDMVSNAFVWLLAKLVNFIVLENTVPHAVSPLSPGARQKEILEHWQSLETELQAWYDGLPDTFNATAVQLPGAETNIEELWFPSPRCASAMQWWHFARIQLLNHKPHVASNNSFTRNELGLGPGGGLAARHASYAQILRESREHARKIIAIGLGRSDEGARVHSVQPLWTAGLVLGGTDATAETRVLRRSILEQLRGIERDMGWAAEYRVQSLLELWGLPGDWEMDKPGGGMEVVKNVLT